MGADSVEIGGDDVIGAFRQSNDIACLAFGVDELAKRIAILGHVDGERQLGRVNRRVGEGPFDPQRSCREGQAFGSDFRAERHALGRAREPECDMNDVVPGGMVRVG